MKLFNSHAIKEIDRATCEAEHINSIDLMERAASAVCQKITSTFKSSKQRIVVIAGPGNNGGDALAVARMLMESDYKRVEVFLFNVKGKLSHDCEIERNRLIAVDDVDFKEITRQFDPPYLCENDVVIDGLFGSGLNEQLQGGFVSLARYINESGAYVVSIDTPSGLFGEWNGNAIRRDMIHANMTLTFQFPRMAFFFEENSDVVGDWEILDIKLNQEKIRTTTSNFFLVEEKSVRYALRPRLKFSSKRDYGSALIMAGSMGMMGAAVLAARAAMRAGAGLVTVHSARCGMNILQTAAPEVMFEPDRNDRCISDMSIHHDHQAVAVGPGIRTYDETITALERLLNNSAHPLILDADALNCISRKPALLTMIPSMSILTPHHGEFDRLFGEHSTSEERLQKAIEMAKQYNIIIVLKGHYTAIVRPDGRVYFNPTGNPGMATAGSGDVLTGVIAAFMAQGYKPELASTIGVYIHGLAGDLAVEKIGEAGLTASDIIDHLGIAIRKILNNTAININQSN